MGLRAVSTERGQFFCLAQRVCYISHIMRALAPALVLFGLMGCSSVPPEETVNPGLANTQDPYASIDEAPRAQGTKPPETVFADPVDDTPYYADPEEDPAERAAREGGYVGPDGRYYPPPLVRQGVKVGRPSSPMPDQLAKAREKQLEEARQKACNCKRPKPPNAWEDPEVMPGERREDALQRGVAQSRKPQSRRPRRLSRRQRLRKWSGIHGQPDGYAAWYGTESHGGTTTSGARRSAFAKTAAHASLPYNSRVRVINLYTGQQVEVTINDRRGTSRKRVMVVSQLAADYLGMIEDGVVPIKVVVLSQPGGSRATARR